MDQIAGLLDFSKPLDIALLDQTVATFFSGRAPKEIQQVLVQFQNHAQAWTRVDSILSQSQNPHTKIIALNVLESTVKQRWKILPLEQRKGIRKFVVGLIITISQDAAQAKAQSVYLSKLDMVLVQILKHDWPQNWPDFIPTLVNSSKTSQSLCANNMRILSLLSEEVFDYSSGQMTNTKIKQMKQNLNREFTCIYQLCDYVFNNSQDPTLLTSTLRTLLRFLHWIPVGYIFETNLLDTLTLKFFPTQLFQNDALRCLTEIGSLKLDNYPQYQPKFVKLFVTMVTQVSQQIQPNLDVAQVYGQGAPNVQTFVRFFCLFVSGFLRAHLRLMEVSEHRPVLLQGLSLFLRMSHVQDDEVFKICLDFWNWFVADLYQTQKRSNLPAPLLLGIKKPEPVELVQLYTPVLEMLRLVIISNMTKPEEVLIVEDENGEVVREHVKNTDSIIMYNNMRTCLVYLTHLDPMDTQHKMLMKLKKQVDNSEFSWRNLNTLCWAIGSIYNALSQSQEKSFLVHVIKNLLELCEMKRGKDHKAIIASNIMYVVGQYPRFLRNHWKFLKTVVNKLFEFMHEMHPGVQDMSCDTFLKIVRKCKHEFIRQQPMERRPFVEDIIEGLRATISDLQRQQILTFYEAVALVVQAEANPTVQQRWTMSLMSMPNETWSEIIVRANRDLKTVFVSQTSSTLLWILQINTRVAAAVKRGYMVQLSRIYVEMLKLYKTYSQFVTSEISRDPIRAKSVEVRNVRGVKKEVLRLVMTVLLHAGQQEQEMVASQLLDVVLQDYKASIPVARDAEVLSLFATMIERNQKMAQYVPTIFDTIFPCTLEMITKNFQDYPDHRLAFFKLLRAINTHAFGCLLRLPPPQFQLIIDSIVWAMKHWERNVSATGLSSLLELLENVHKSEVSNQFYKKFFLPLLQDVFAVLTDTLHKPGFSLQATILAKLFQIADTGAIAIPLWNPEKGESFPNNPTCVRAFVTALLGRSFPNLSRQSLEAFITGMFQFHSQLPQFKKHLRDFLVRLKEFDGDNSELFLEEQQKTRADMLARANAQLASVPGLRVKGGAGAELQLQAQMQQLQGLHQTMQ